MVRFNDKNPIENLASNDIMPITDMSDTTDDKKVTIEQIGKYTVNNISTLSGGKVLTDNNLTDALKSNYDTAYNTLPSKADTDLSNLTPTGQNKFDAKQNVITGGASTVTDVNLEASRALISDTSGKIGVSPITSTELSYLDNVTSNVQTQLNGKANTDLSNLTSSGQSKLDAKQNTITGGASTITSTNLTANRALVSNSEGKVIVSGVTSTELNYLDNVTSNVQTQLNSKQATITGGASSITKNNLTASRALVSDTSGKVAVSAVTSTELGHLDGVTSNVQTQLNSKQATITGGASSVTTANLTANRAVIADNNGKISVSPVTSAELNYLDGVTSNVQTQLNSKANTDLSNLTPAGIQVIVNNSGLDFAGMPVGSIFSHTCSASFVPENSLPCDGSEYSKTQFSTFYTDWLVGAKLNTCTYTEYQQEITTYGKCAKFGLDTVNGKFKVPYIPDGTFIQSAMTDDELGKSYNAGLPNIEGEFGQISKTSQISVKGAFYTKPNIYNNNAMGNDGNTAGIGFDASKSNSIYSNSDTVQPNAVALRFFVVVATGSIKQSQMDWSQWATGLASKVDVSNMYEVPCIVESYVSEDGTSGYIVYSNGLCEQWGYESTAIKNPIIQLLKPYKDVNYNVILGQGGKNNSKNSYSDYVNTTSEFTTSSFKINKQDTNVLRYAYWRTLGYIS